MVFVGHEQADNQSHPHIFLSFLSSGFSDPDIKIATLSLLGLVFTLVIAGGQGQWGRGIVLF